MTDMPENGREPLEQWLADRHRDFCDGLGQFLDPHAGLREATVLHAGHTRLLSAFESQLDTQAGLAAILPTPEVAAPPSPAAPPQALDITAAISAVDPAVRVALRRNPVILAAILSDLTARALVIADEARANRGLDHELASDLALDLARDLGRARRIARDLDLDFDCDLDNACILAKDFALAVDRGLLRDIARNFDLARASVLARVLAIARDVVRCTFALDRARGLDHELASDLAFDLVRDIDRARILASDLSLARDLGRDLGLGRARDLAHQAAQAAGNALGIRKVEGLAGALLEGVLDDFTHADLTHADLTTCDLTGVRWSDWGTKWPPGTDIDALRGRSQEVGHDTGVYVITNPDEIDETVHHAPV